MKSHTVLWIIMSIGSFILFEGCHSRPDYKKIKEEISALHKANINAPLEKDISFLTQNISDPYFVVKNGEISRPDFGEIKSNFNDYLKHTTFTEYREVEEPLIGYSNDGSIIWAVGKIKVQGVSKMDDGTEKSLDFTCAWITLYKCVNDKLIRLGDVSTFK